MDGLTQVQSGSSTKIPKRNPKRHSTNRIICRHTHEVHYLLTQKVFAYLSNFYIRLFPHLTRQLILHSRNRMIGRRVKAPPSVVHYQIYNFLISTVYSREREELHHRNELHHY